MLAIAFIISRIIFANAGPVFFDSPEYLARLADPNLWHALTSGHLPLHAGYILLLWPIYHLSPSLVIPFQILLGLAGIVCFYYIVVELETRRRMRTGAQGVPPEGKAAEHPQSLRRVALVSTILVSLLPLLWISQVTIMMEAVYVPLFFISAYFLVRRRYLLFSIFYFLSTLTHPGVLLWFPWLIYISPNRRSTIFYSLISIFLGLVSFIPKLGEHIQFSLLPVIRNILIPTLRNNTNLIVILASVSFIKLFINHKSSILNHFLWLAPVIVTNQWWDSLFFGRHALIASFGLAYLTALQVSKFKFQISLVIVYLLLTSVPALALLRGPIPYLEEAKFAASLPPGGIYITSHFARPQLQGVYPGTTVFVNEPGWESSPATASALYVSPSAISDPYDLYSGPYLHLLSISPATYRSPRRLDYYDPITQLWFRFFSSPIFSSASRI